jgi:tetratricopeptide (TPR) repeat protein
VAGILGWWEQAVDRTVTTTEVTGLPNSDAAGEPGVAKVTPLRSSLPREPANDQVVAGSVPREPAGFQPPADLLAELDRVDAGVSVVHAATELRGAGTTQVAAAYARAKLAAGWRLVAWVNAEDTGSLLAGLAAVADAAGLYDDGSGRDATDPGQVLRHHLETDGDRCLLVFDDAADPDALQPFIPVGGAARVLITGARPSTANPGTNVSVDVFSSAEALAYLTRRTGLNDEAGAAAVAADLGHLPLPLAQAAAVISAEHLGYDAYLERLRALPVSEYLSREDRQAYPPRAAEAVLLSLESVLATDQSGMCTRMMQIIAVLSAAGIQREILHAAGQAGVLANGRHRVSAALVDRALAQLAERSLLTFSLDGQTIIAHRLVTQVVHDGLARRKWLTAVCRAAASVLEARALALAASQNRQAVRAIPEQVTALLDHTAVSAGEADKELARVLLRLRFLALYHLIELGDSAAQAISVGEPLTADLEWVLGPDHPDTMNARNSLAAAYQATGRVAEAIPLFEQTLIGRERQLGPDHPDTLTSRNNLANAYQDAGRVAEAIPLHEQTLAACERLLGADDPSTLTSQGNLAAAYQDTGRVAEAILLFEQTLAARVRVLGKDHPDTRTSRNNLANAYREAGRAAEAIPLVEQTLAARERLLGADHPKTLAARNNLAAAYRDAGRAAEAILLFEQTLAARERLLGPDHPSTLASRNNLAAAYLAAGRVAEATPLHEKALAACERLLGGDHPRTVAARNNLASTYQEAGRTAEAIPLLEQTLAAREQLLGPDHPSTVATRNNLALACQDADESKVGRSQLASTSQADFEGVGDEEPDDDADAEGDVDGFAEGDFDGLGDGDCDTGNCPVLPVAGADWPTAGAGLAAVRLPVGDVRAEADVRAAAGVVP